MRGLLQRQFGGLPRAFWVLWVATFINRVGGFVVILLAIYLTQQRHLDPAIVGLAVGLVGGGNAVGAVIGGHLADIWGRRGVLLAGHVAAACAMVVMAFATDTAIVIVVAALLGLAQGIPRPAFGAMVIDVVPSKDRLRALNLLYWVLNLGFTVAALLGGFLATFDFTLVFVIDALSTLAAGVLVWSLVAETKPERTTEVDDDTNVNPYRDRVFTGLLIFGLLGGIIFGQSDAMLPIAMVDQGLSAQTYGWVIAINGLMIVAGQLFVPRLIRGVDLTTMLAVSSVILGAGFGMFAFAHTAGAFAFGVVVLTIGEMLNVGPWNTLMAELSPLHGRGRYQGAAALSRGIASFAAPVIGGAVYQWHPNALWAGAFGLSVVAALIVLPMRDAQRRRIAEIAAQG